MHMHVFTHLNLCSVDRHDLILKFYNATQTSICNKITTIILFVMHICNEINLGRNFGGGDL